MTRPLPERDLDLVFHVVLQVHSALHSDTLPDDLVDRLARRLTEYGLLPAGASKGELNAVLGDLVQVLHWAMDPEPGRPYPAPAAREVKHHVVFGTGEAAARAFAAEAGAGGGRDPWARPGHSRWRAGPDGAREPADPPGTWLVDVRFGELPPDPGFDARQAQLTEMAARHGGEYTGTTG